MNNSSVKMMAAIGPDDFNKFLKQQQSAGWEPIIESYRATSGATERTFFVRYSILLRKDNTETYEALRVLREELREGRKAGIE